MANDKDTFGRVYKADEGSKYGTATADFTNQILGDTSGMSSEDIKYLQDMNPYLKTNYDLNWWQQLGHTMFGNSVSEDAYFNQRFQAAQEKHAELMAELEKRKYNSPLNQSQLDQMAGRNPALTDISGTSQAEVPAHDETSPEVPNGDSQTQQAIGAIANTFSGVGRAIQAGFDIYSQILNNKSTKLSIENQDLQNDSLVLDNFDKSGDAVRKMVKMLIKYNNRNEKGVELGPGYSYNHIKEIGSKLAKGDYDAFPFESALGLSLRSYNTKKNLAHQLSQFISSQEFDRLYAEETKNTINSGVELGKAFGSPSYNVEKTSDFTGLVTYSANLYRPILKLELDLLSGKYNREIAENRYNKNYYNSMSGSQMGTFTQSIQRNKAIQEGYKSNLLYFQSKDAKLDYDLKTAQRSIVSKLAKDAREGNEFAAALLMGYFYSGEIFNVGKQLLFK